MATLTITDAARVTGVSRMLLYRYIKAGSRHARCYKIAVQGRLSVLDSDGRHVLRQNWSGY
jgi:predicted site-specific integrase-resolvase